MDQTESTSIGEVVICACRSKEYTARDVIDAALFRGELDSIWKEFLIDLKVEERADELELEIDHDAVDAAAELFRYHHDLITAEETEQWLEARSLTLENFTDYFIRHSWGAVVHETLKPENVDLVRASADLRELFTAELIFSDKLDRLGQSLMWRLAALGATGENNLDREKINREKKAFFDRLEIKEPELHEWLGHFGRDQGWLDHMLALEAAYGNLCDKTLTVEARQRQLTTLRMPLTQFEVEVVELESSEAAKEALLCIRQDEMSMEQVAAEARYPFRRISLHYEAVPEELKQKFWSAAPGDVLDPVGRGEGFELYRITRKVEPKLTDPNVQQRVDRDLLERHFAILASEHIEPRLNPVIRNK
ncbi:MAG TPA: hypothetical protein VJ721_06905 [Chthoniobacterales bacterium]|nr:hypothetical protein [Chthoniobacterales bacterium]